MKKVNQRFFGRSAVSLPSFTLMEMATVMLLSSILTFMVYLSFENIEKYASLFKTHLQAQGDQDWFRVNLENDFLLAETISLTDNKLIFNRNQGNVTYEFTSEGPLVIRTQGILVDSVSVTASLGEVDYVTTDSLVQRAVFLLEESELLLVKSYPAKYLVQPLNAGQ